MLGQGFVSAAAIAASVLFILSLGGLSNQEKAKRAVWYGIVGMAVAVFFTAFGPGIGGYWWLIPMMIIGAGIGVYLAGKVEMTEMPQLVAALHSFVGLAAVFVAWSADLERRRVMAAQAADASMEQFSAFAALVATKAPDELMFLQIEVVFAIFIGAVTFTGSVIAFGKLAGKVDGKPRQLPGGHMLNAGAAAVSLLLAILYLNGAGFWTLILLAALSFFIGYHLIMGIGGADMPVVVSMLNSYSGWAAAAVGFTLSNDLLIVT
ncbi:MAG: NAD(P) transhydrogenase beta subunit, partial [Halomonas sp. HL-93]